MKDLILLNQAIQELAPNQGYTMENDNLDTLVFDSGLSVNHIDINNKYNSLLQHYESTQYQRDRAEAYASIAEQLDMQYWDRVNGTSTWKEHIDAVKAAHPKPTGE